MAQRECIFVLKIILNEVSLGRAITEIINKALNVRVQGFFTFQPE